MINFLNACRYSDSYIKSLGSATISLVYFFLSRLNLNIVHVHLFDVDAVNSFSNRIIYFLNACRYSDSYIKSLGSATFSIK